MDERLKCTRELQALQTHGDARIPIKDILEKILQQWRLDDDRVKRKNTARIGVDASVPSDDGMFESVSVLGRFPDVLG